jgi:hypothetical protein
MPLTAKGKKIKKAMEKTYGKEQGEKVFYAMEKKNKNTNMKKDKDMAKKVGYMKGGMVKDKAKVMPKKKDMK